MDDQEMDNLLIYFNSGKVPSYREVRTNVRPKGVDETTTMLSRVGLGIALTAMLFYSLRRSTMFGV